jgi:hypothetical protein
MDAMVIVQTVVHVVVAFRSPPSCRRGLSEDVLTATVSLATYNAVPSAYQLHIPMEFALGLGG